MKKTYRVEVDCPTCAAKLEDCAKKQDGVEGCSANLITQKMIIDAPMELQETIIKEIARKMKSIDDDVEIYLS